MTFQGFEKKNCRYLQFLFICKVTEKKDFNFKFSYLNNKNLNIFKKIIFYLDY